MTKYDAVFIGGAVLVAVGLWVAWPPAALLFTGALAMVLAVLVGANKDDHGRDSN